MRYIALLMLLPPLVPGVACSPAPPPAAAEAPAPWAVLPEGADCVVLPVERGGDSALLMAGDDACTLPAGCEVRVVSDPGPESDPARRVVVFAGPGLADCGGRGASGARTGEISRRCLRPR